MQIQWSASAKLQQVSIFLRAHGHPTERVCIPEGHAGGGEFEIYPRHSASACSLIRRLSMSMGDIWCLKLPSLDLRFKVYLIVYTTKGNQRDPSNASH